MKARLRRTCEVKTSARCKHHPRERVSHTDQRKDHLLPLFLPLCKEVERRTMKGIDSNESCEGNKVPSCTEPNASSKPKKSSPLDSPRRVQAENNSNCRTFSVDDGRPDGEKESEMRKEEEEKDERKAETATEGDRSGTGPGRIIGATRSPTTRRVPRQQQPAVSPGVL